MPDHLGDVTTVDTGLVRQGMAASYLLVRNGRAAFVDTGASPAVPSLLRALERQELAPEQVDYVLLTHVHLDHAGGAGALMRTLPGAQLVVHPRGARHMVDPARLVHGARRVYGEALFARLFGEILPTPAERVLETEDEMVLELGGSPLRILHTPGHAVHHCCFVDPAAGVAFAGDSFGVSYRELDTEHGAFAFPACTPTDFDPDAAHATLDRILGHAPNEVFVTHYGRLGDAPRLAASLHADLDVFVAIAQRHHTRVRDRHRAIAEDLWAYILERLHTHGCRLRRSCLEELIGLDVDLNARGLDVWCTRRLG